MVQIHINLKIGAVCYAVLSLPYVGLALDLRSADPDAGSFKVLRGISQAQRDHADVQARALSMEPSTSLKSNIVVNSSTVVANIPKDHQEVFYFRNFTMVGKKSEGFNITQFDIDVGHPDRSQMTSAERLAAGDSLLTNVAAGILAGAALAGACVLISTACGTFIGTNIRTFVAAVANVPASSGEAGQAAVNIVTNAVGSAPAALPAPTRKHKRDYTLEEEFGCFYENSYEGTCTNEDVTDSAYQTIVNNDGGDANTPIWTCYESSDSIDGTIFGFYSHCFADDEACELQCGTGNPEITDWSTPNNIGTPSK